MMKRISLSIIIVLAILGFICATKPPSLLEARRGAILFTQYCAGCHSLRFLSLDRIAQDLKLKSPQNRLHVLAPNSPYVGLTPSMPKQDAKQWFGKMPPDLTFIAKIRSKSWLQDYLSGFYTDASQPFGANNLMLPNTAMPNILFPLQGQQTLLKNQNKMYMKQVQPGSITSHEFEQIVQDLVIFLDYAAEPTQWQRHFIGYIIVGLFFGLSGFIGLIFMSSLRQNVNRL